MFHGLTGGLTRQAASPHAGHPRPIRQEAEAMSLTPTAAFYTLLVLWTACNYWAPKGRFIMCNQGLRHTLILCGFLFIFSGCAKHVTIRPPVNTSLGYTVFQALGEIHRSPLHIGLHLEPKLRTETIRVSRELGTAEIAIGEILSAKLIQALSYKFARITLTDDPKSAPPLLLIIALEGEAPAVGVDIHSYPHLSGASTFEVVAKVDARLRATLSDNGRAVWVGHARVVEEMQSGGAAYGAAEGSTQAAELTSRMSDRLVADLMLQMQRSTELKKTLEEKRP